MVIPRRGMNLITRRNLRDEITHARRKAPGEPGALPAELRHYGCCQQATAILYFGHDYTQVNPSPGTKPFPPAPASGQPFCVIDLKHGTKFATVDFSRFDGSPGSMILVEPKLPVLFTHVTVRICDLFDRELIHAPAIDIQGNQEWIFAFDDRHLLKPYPLNLSITIRASEAPRVPESPLVDLYEMPAEELAQFLNVN